MRSPPPSAPPPALLSVVIPARNEAGCLAGTVEQLSAVLSAARIRHEIVVVDDGSEDETPRLLTTLLERLPELKAVRNEGPHGFGRAVTLGFGHARGDALIVMMADGSDDPADAVRYWLKLQEGWDAVFGSRFIRGARVSGYPLIKLLLNRVANFLLRALFHIRLNDTTNAFKAYRRETVEGCRPFLAPHFNLTVELPLKTIVRGYSWTVIPISWRGRQTGASKLKIKEMGSRYLFIALYCWLEKYFSRGDYRAQGRGPGGQDRGGSGRAAAAR